VIGPGATRHSKEIFRTVCQRLKGQLASWEDDGDGALYALLLGRRRRGVDAQCPKVAPVLLAERLWYLLPTMGSGIRQ